MDIKAFKVESPPSVSTTIDGRAVADPQNGIFALFEGPKATSNEELSKLHRTLRELLPHVKATHGNTEGAIKSLIGLVRGIVQQACSATQSASGSSEEVARALCVVVIVEERAVVGCYGDAKLFLIRHGVFSPLTPKERVASEGASRLRAATPLNIFHFEILAGDRLVLASGGTSEIFAEPSQYARALNSVGEPSILAERIQFIARSNGYELSAPLFVALALDGTPDQSEAEEMRRAEVTLRTESLQQIYLFRDLELAELLEIAERSILLVARDGEAIFLEGQQGEAMYLIVEGRCQVLKGNTVVSHLDAGAHFGEMSLLTNDPRSGTITALERTRLLRISREDFQDVLHASPATGVKILSALGRELSRRLAEANRHHS